MRFRETEATLYSEVRILLGWFFGLWPIRIPQAYGPRFLQLKKLITIYITHDYQASDENEPWGWATS